MNRRMHCLSASRDMVFYLPWHERLRHTVQMHKVWHTLFMKRGVSSWCIVCTGSADGFDGRLHAQSR